MKIRFQSGMRFASDTEEYVIMHYHLVLVTDNEALSQSFRCACKELPRITLVTVKHCIDAFNLSGVSPVDAVIIDFAAGDPFCSSYLRYIAPRAVTAVVGVPESGVSEVFAAACNLCYPAGCNPAKVVADVDAAMRYLSVAANQKDHSLQNTICDLFLTAGISPHNKGFRFLNEAVMIGLKEPRALANLSKLVYPRIAFKYNTTPTGVERAIRFAIESAWNRGHMERLRKKLGTALGDDRLKPTNSELIALLIYKLEADYAFSVNS